MKETAIKGFPWIFFGGLEPFNLVVIARSVKRILPSSLNSL